MLQTKFALFASLSHLEQELKDIKQRLIVLENILPVNEQLAGSDGSTDCGSAGIQLILSDKSLGWKAALRRVLVLSFGIRTLGKLSTVRVQWLAVL